MAPGSGLSCINLIPGVTAKTSDVKTVTLTVVNV